MTSNGPEISSNAASPGRPLLWTLGTFSFLLAIVLAIFFWDVLLGFRTFVFRDYGLFGYPLASYNRDLFWQGDLPLWNPLSNSGIPYLAQWNTMTLYPLSVIYLFFPLTWALPVFCIGHLFLGGVGMFVLARSWVGSASAAAIAGAAYAVNGLMLNSLMWPNNIAALGLLPWVIWSVHMAATRGRRWCFGAALIGATQMLAGAPEIIIFTWLIAGAFTLLSALQAGRSAPAIILRAIGVVLLTSALVLIQILPFLDLLKHSQRTAGVVGYESAMPPWGWANFVAPLFHTYRSSSGVNFQAGQVWTSSYYISIIALALAFIGIRRNDKRTWLLLAGALFCALLALGHSGYVYTSLRKLVPQMAIMNFPIKFVVPVIFALPLLAAFGLARVNTRVKPGQKADKWSFAVPICLSLILAALAYWAHTYPRESGEGPAVVANSFARLFFLAAGSWLLLRLRASQGDKAFWMSGAILALIFLDVRGHAPWQNPTTSPAVYERSLQANRKLNPLPTNGLSRAMLTGSALHEFRFAMKKDPFITYIGHRLGLYDNCNLIEHLPKVDGFFSLYLAHETPMRSGLNGRTNPPAGLLNFLGVSHYSKPGNIIEFLPRTNFLPMVTIGQEPRFVPETSVLGFLFADSFDPTKVVYLSNPPTNWVTISAPVEAKIVDQNITPENLRIRYSAPEPTIITIAQSWYPHWQATIDGQPAPLLRANYAYQAVPVPAGEHTLEVRYVDMQFRKGAIISGLALAFCLTGLFWPRKLSRNDDIDPGDRQRPQSGGDPVNPRRTV